MINEIKIICTIIGTFIGAGFASGKEIYLFFYKFGVAGLAGIVISSAVIEYILIKVMYISKYNNIENYDEFLNFIIKNKYMRIFFKKIINIFLILSFGIMSAGFSAFLKQEFNLNKIISYIFILFLLYLILRKKVNGILKINNILIPIIISIIIVIINIIIINKFNYIKNNNLNIVNNNYSFFIFSILYANYNLLTINPILVTLTHNVKLNKIKMVSYICTIIISIIAIYIFFILYNENNAVNMEMPIINILGRYRIIYKYIYSCVIVISIFTTAMSTGYGYLQQYENNLKLYNKKILILIILASFTIYISFSKLVELIYPIFGVLGIIQSVYIINFWKNYKKVKKLK